MINAYKSIHWGSGIINNHQNSYLIFNERDLPQFAMVTIYLQLPHYEYPNMLKGLYLCLDYNHNPIARRIVMMKQSDSTAINDFLKMEGKIVPRAELTPELEVYYNYTCQKGDYIKTCLHHNSMNRIWKEKRKCYKYKAPFQYPIKRQIPQSFSIRKFTLWDLLFDFC